MPLSRAVEEVHLRFPCTIPFPTSSSLLTSALIGVLVFLMLLPFGYGDSSSYSDGFVKAASAAAVDAEAVSDDSEGNGAPVVAEEDKLSSQELEELVGRIALYPDELVAQVLPASTFPLDVVEAARFVGQNESVSEPPEDTAWDPSVISLLAFPTVLAMMSDDIGWTRQLGDALWVQEADVYDAIQAFRQRVEAAGNLESNEKVVVVKEKETITIVPAQPEVVYVPVYQPQTVVVYRSSPAPLIVWGSAIAFSAWAYSVSWGRHHHHSVHYHRHYSRHYHNHHYKKHRKHYRSSSKYGHRGGSWKPSHRPGSGRPGYGGNRPGRPGKPGHAGSHRPGSSWGKPGKKPGGGMAGRPGGGSAGRPGSGKLGRPGSGNSDRSRVGKATQPRRSTGNFGGYDRGNDARKSAARGTQSRQVQRSGTNRPSSSRRVGGSRGGSFGQYGSGRSVNRNSSRGASSRGSAGRGSSGRRGGGRSRSGGGRKR